MKVRLIYLADAAAQWQLLAAKLKADSAGYVEVTLKDESQQAAYFDDLSLRIVKERGVQEHHYDPWGLDLVGIEQQPADRIERRQYNGKDRVSEHGLEWNFHEARTLDRQIPHWWQVDPLAGERSQWSPYQFGRNNPLLNADPSGALDGEYYTQKGDLLRSDGINDGKLYVVTGKETIELPSTDLRGQMGEAVDRSNSPSGDDKTGGNHEEGGIIATTSDGAPKVFNTDPGPYTNPASGKAETATLDYNPAVQRAYAANDGQPVGIVSLFHVHPASAGFVQEVSGRDLLNAKTNADRQDRGKVQGNSYVLAAGNKTVYIYNGKGQRATFPLEAFRRLAPK